MKPQKFRAKPDLITEEKTTLTPSLDRLERFNRNLGFLEVALKTSSNETAKNLLRLVRSALQCALRDEDFNPLKS